MMWYDIWHFQWLSRCYDIFDILDNAHWKQYYPSIFLQLAAKSHLMIVFCMYVVLAYSDHGIFYDVWLSCSVGVRCVAHGRAE